MSALFKFGNIEDAFLFVSAAHPGDHQALVLKSQGRILWSSEASGCDEISEEDWKEGNAVEITHAHDLHLGTRLVFDFIGAESPDEYQHVRRIFSRRGAYGRFKEFLMAKGLLQSWHDFEHRAQESALRRWCRDSGIQLSD